MAKKKEQMQPYPLGAHCEGKKIRFAFASQKDSCGVILYDRKTGEQLKKIAFTPEEKIGNIYCKKVKGVDPASVSYHFYEEEVPVADKRARAFADKPIYGLFRTVDDMKAIPVLEDFDWGKDRKIFRPNEESIVYCLHVRGFTMDPSSGVKGRGTFAGMAEKIPYLKEIGVTTVELQPAYEFAETEDKGERSVLLGEPVYTSAFSDAGEDKRKINYWGYKEGYYYAPKGSYAQGPDPVRELKSVIKEFHKNNLEIIMQFYFPSEIAAGEIAEILRFWVLEYHIDGFHLIGEGLPVQQLAQDPLFADTKIWYNDQDTPQIYGSESSGNYHLAVYNEDYLYAMRKFLKGDEDMLNAALYHMRHIPQKAGRIHYLSNYFGMTLKDMVSYDYKHNEGNGEHNKDGIACNCSWNCGEEGPSRKKKVQELRIKQLKNAMCLLLFSQSAPLIFMGDEFGNSQQGNNNPYCQDNSITWLNWKDKEHNQEIFDFWKKLAAIRKEHPVLRPAKEKRLMDYLSCGYPDLSYHSRNAWQPETEPCDRHIGIMFCGKYAEQAEEKEDDFFYLAINMHWEPHELALPRLPKGLEWKRCLYTCNEEMIKEAEGSSIKEIPPRSIIIYKSEVVE